VPDDVATRARRATRARSTALGLLGLLLVLTLIVVLREAQGIVAAVLLGLVLVMPLLLPLGGLVHRRRRVYAWATLCLTPHVVYSLTEIVAHPAVRVLAAAVLLASLALLLALVAYLRLTR
jgi:uncharacterized membrane protein